MIEYQFSDLTKAKNEHSCDPCRKKSPVSDIYFYENRIYIIPQQKYACCKSYGCYELIKNLLIIISIKSPDHSLVGNILRRRREKITDKQEYYYGSNGDYEEIICLWGTIAKNFWIYDLRDLRRRFLNDLNLIIFNNKFFFVLFLLRSDFP